MGAAPPPVPQVEAVLATCTDTQKLGLLALRAMIFRRAADLPRIGRLSEALRWGQPAYLTPDTGAGCSLRIGPSPGGDFAVFVHCKTGLIDSYLAGPGVGLRVQGTRAVLFQTADEIPASLSLLIGQALTYHLHRLT